MKFQRKKRKIWSTNRSITRRPQKSKYWCNFCDANLIRKGQKCGICGHKDIGKNFKK